MHDGAVHHRPSCKRHSPDEGCGCDRGRGGDDVIASHDLEDIIAVVDGRPKIGGDMAAASEDVRAYVRAEIRTLLDNRDFTEALAGFLLPDPASQARRSLLEVRLRSLSTS